MKKYGVQMFGMRDIADKDMKLALKTAAEIGYKQIEFAGFYKNEPEKVRECLDELGLEAVSTHTGIDAIVPERIEQTIAAHKAIGCKYVTLPGIWMNTREELDKTINLLNYAQPILEKEGLTLCVHNHWREFKPTDYGAISHEELEAKTNVKFQLDTFWAFFAGKDPIALMEYYYSLGRLTMIHLKDGVLDNSKKAALGEGEAPVEAILTKALELNIPIIVESEGLYPTGAEENARCFEFLKKYHETH